VSSSYTYVIGDELRPLAYNIAANYPDDDTPMALASGWTATVVVCPQGSDTASFTVSSGITLADTYPNVVVNWATSGQLNSLTAGMYTVRLRLVSAGGGRYTPSPFPTLLMLTDST
jgi:hypothetical protein